MRIAEMKISACRFFVTRGISETGRAILLTSCGRRLSDLLAGSNCSCCLTKPQVRRAQQARVVTAFGAHDSGCYSWREHPLRDFMHHVRFEEVPGICHATANHDHLRIENVYDVGNGNSEIKTYLPKE